VNASLTQSLTLTIALTGHWYSQSPHWLQRVWSIRNCWEIWKMALVGQ